MIRGIILEVIAIQIMRFLSTKAENHPPSRTSKAAYQRYLTLLRKRSTNSDCRIDDYLNPTWRLTLGETLTCGVRQRGQRNPNQWQHDNLLTPRESWPGTSLSHTIWKVDSQPELERFRCRQSTTFDFFLHHHHNPSIPFIVPALNLRPHFKSTGKLGL